MKKYIAIIMIVLLLSILFIFINYYNSNIAVFYRKQWNVNIPEPNKIETIIKHDVFQEVFEFSLMYYDINATNKIELSDMFKKIDIDLKNNYYKIREHFIKYLTMDELKTFNDIFNKDELFNENNYYMLLENKDSYRLNLLVFNTQNNILYSIDTTY